MYKILAQINKIILPNFTKQDLDISRAMAMTIVVYRYFVMTCALW
jgi:hypothetical protein